MASLEPGSDLQPAHDRYHLKPETHQRQTCSLHTKISIQLHPPSRYPQTLPNLSPSSSPQKIRDPFFPHSPPIHQPGTNQAPNPPPIPTPNRLTLTPTPNIRPNPSHPNNITSIRARKLSGPVLLSQVRLKTTIISSSWYLSVHDGFPAKSMIDQPNVRSLILRPFSRGGRKGARAAVGVPPHGD